ncbi:MAG TPA: Ku protein [Myxococcota bacterium]|nr:Ku protein [Myxococcota bacterium]
MIRADRVSLPVKLYAAAREARIGFHLLHAADRVRVEQQMVDPNTGKPVPNHEIRRGYPLDGERFVVLEPEELEKLTPAQSQDIQVTRFVPPGAVAPGWYVRPYYVGPDGDVAGYRGLCQALARRKRIGITHWTMRSTSYVGALLAHDGGLALVRLRHRDEVVSAEELSASEGRAPDPLELAMAEQLVSALAGEFDPTAFRDEHRARLQALLDAKASGRKPQLAALPRRAPAPELASALRRSLEQLNRSGVTRSRTRGA